MGNTRSRPAAEGEALRQIAAESVEDLDLGPVRRVFDAFLAVSGMAMALVSPSGKVLAASNWQLICSAFFRAHPETKGACEDTDKAIGAAIASMAAGVLPAGALPPDQEPGLTFPLRYRCANGLREIAQPLFIEGVHWATIYLGQFLYEEDEADEAGFALRAREFGWDEAAFVEALRAVPRYTKEEVERALEFCVSFGDLVSKLNYSYYRERLLARQYLQADRELSAALEQKDFLFAELQHRVKNSLTLIASLLSLESASFSDERTRRAFEEAQGRIRAVALLYERLYETRSVESIDLGAYVADAARASFKGLGGPESRIAFEAACSPLELDTRRAIYVGLVVHELAVNALKHAFPGEGGGRFRVALRREGEEALLEAADDGVGLPPGFSLESRSSLGVLVVRTLARQLGGSVVAGPGLSGGSGPGAAFVLRFPI